MSPIAWRVEHFDEIDSTNTYLASRVNDDVAEGLVALADFQRSGRGRSGRTWLSPARASLLCSILLRPAIDPARLQLVVAAVALAARSAIARASGVRPDLKWPNDLIVGENKIAGVLAEVVRTNDALAVVAGLGVNLTQRGPDGVRATSVLAESGVAVAPRSLLDLVLEELEARRNQLDSVQGQRALREEYVKALATIGQVVRVERGHDVLVGEAQGVDDAGRLQVAIDGVVRTFDVGDVIHVRPIETETA